MNNIIFEFTVEELEFIKCYWKAGLAKSTLEKYVSDALVQIEDEEMVNIGTSALRILRSISEEDYRELNLE